VTGTGPALLALDFDGVICDSAGESCLASWHAFRSLWGASPEDPPVRVLEVYRRLRPVIETGWENYVLMRLIVDRVPEQTILERFHDLCAEVLERYGLRTETLVERFGRARDEWMARDREAWLASQPAYPGVAEAVRGWLADGQLIYVITTKQARFASLLLEHYGIALPEGRLLALEAGPKTDSLARLSGEHGIEARDMWFVEDRLATLERAAAVPGLDGLGLFLADWGYNTEGERARARSDRRVTTIDLQRFAGPFERWRAPVVA
jgi:phosphoglycolate phosphatase-like HAD superfamily hydrolase